MMTREEFAAIDRECEEQPISQQEYIERHRNQRDVLYSIRLDIGRMNSAVQSSDDEVISSGISNEEMLGMVRSALDSPYVRKHPTNHV